MYSVGQQIVHHCLPGLVIQVILINIGLSLLFHLLTQEVDIEGLELSG